MTQRIVNFCLDPPYAFIIKHFLKNWHVFNFFDHFGNCCSNAVCPLKKILKIDSRLPEATHHP